MQISRTLYWRACLLFCILCLTRSWRDLPCLSDLTTIDLALCFILLYLRDLPWAILACTLFLQNFRRNYIPSKCKHKHLNENFFPIIIPCTPNKKPFKHYWNVVVGEGNLCLLTVTSNNIHKFQGYWYKREGLGNISELQELTILIPIAHFVSLSRQGLGTRKRRALGTQNFLS